MASSVQKDQIPREQMIAIRQARRYLRADTGVLARVLNAYKAAEARGSTLGYLPEK